MNNVTLYSAAADVRELLEQIDPDSGELPPEFEQARAVVATKSRACAAFILENDAQADYVEQHCKTLMERVKAARKKSQWLRGYLANHMRAAGILQIKSDDGTFRAVLERNRDKSIEIFDIAQLPQDCMREIPATQEPDKILIRRVLDKGFDVPGAKIVSKDRLTIR